MKGLNVLKLFILLKMANKKKKTKKKIKKVTKFMN